MSDSDADRGAYQERVSQLAADVAARLGAEPHSEITAHLARVAARQTSDPGPALDDARRALDASPGIPDDIGERRSRAALADALVQLAGEVAAHRRAMEALLVALADSFRPATHHHPDLEGELDALHDRFAVAERTRPWSPTDLDVIARLEALERARRDDEPPAAAASPPTALADQREDLAARLRDLVPDLADPLASVGPTAAAVLDSLSRPAAVQGADALAVSAPGALGGVVVTEADHLPPGAIAGLVSAAARALRPGGRLVLSATDPSSLAAHVGALHLDADRRSTLHPQALDALGGPAGLGPFDLHDDRASAPPVRSPELAGVDEDEPLEQVHAALAAPQHFIAVAER